MSSLHQGILIGLVSLPVILFTAAIRNRRSNGNPKSTTNNNHTKKSHNKNDSNDNDSSMKLGIIGVLGFGSIGILLFGAVLIILRPDLLKGNAFLQRFVSNSDDATKVCDIMLKSYKPLDLVGIYGDMKGQYHRDVDTSSAMSAELFDQGMIHIYGFNQIEGIRNMRAALEVDKDCAMCYWAIAQASGPNINTEVSEDMATTGKIAIDQAYTIMTTKLQRQQTLTTTSKDQPSVNNNGFLSDVNAALIVAQRTRFSFSTIDLWRDHGQVVYDDKYAEAMRALTLLHAGTEHTLDFDPDVHAIYAEAVVNQSPWQYYLSQLPLMERTEAMAIALENPINPKDDPTGILVELTPSMVSSYLALGSVLTRTNYRHPLALHLWIHVTESGTTPARGLSAADALAQLSRNGTSGTGHLLHMPAHIYLRTGRYVECIASSLIAIASDRMYESKCLVPYVPSHNVAMLVSAALYSGRMQLATEYSPYILMSPESAIYLSAIYASPKDIVMVRYGQWDQVIYLQEQQQKEYDRQTKEQETLAKAGGIFSLGNGKGKDEGKTSSPVDYLDATTVPPYVRSIHLYARVLAYVGIGDITIARTGLGRLRSAINTIPYDSLGRDHPFYPYHREMGEMLGAIALSSFSIRFSGNSEAAVKLLTDAVAEQDSWSYMEPENFYLPVRHCLGAALLKQAEDLMTSRPSQLTPPSAGSRALRDSTTIITDTVASITTDTTTTTAAAATSGMTRRTIEDSSTTTTTTTTTQLRDLYTQAISVYEADLQSHPATGWSLKGLMMALQGLGTLGDTHLGQGLGKGIGLSPATATTTSSSTITAVVDAGKKENGSNEEEEVGLVRISEYLPLVQAAFDKAWSAADDNFKNIRGSCCELSLC